MRIYTSPAVNRAVQKYNKKKYDRFTLRFKKGQKQEVFAFAKARGKSLNSYIIGLIEKDIEKNAIVF